MPRFISFVVRACRAMPAALDLAWLRWARAHMSKHNPTHPDLPDVIRRIAHLEDRCNA